MEKKYDPDYVQEEIYRQLQLNSHEVSSRNKTFAECNDDLRNAVKGFLAASGIAKKIDQSMLRLSRALRKKLESEKDD